MNKFTLYYRTVKHLRFRQIFYRVFYGLRNRVFAALKVKFCLAFAGKTGKVELQESVAAFESYIGDGVFVFLNREKRFLNEIEWNFAGYGRLWTYNLNYFDYLLQPSFDKSEGLTLMRDFIDRGHEIKTGYEPYPTSLRIVNWIKFCALHGIRDSAIDASLYAQLKLLTHNIEYHLMANHLLENAFAMLFGAVYFNETRLRERAKNILRKELNEQILADGAHFELSTMYHKIILFRLLDCYNLMINNDRDYEFASLAKEKIALMSGWLESVSFRNGDLPHFNDSTEGIAPSTKKLLLYAERLNLASKYAPLSASGYRKLTTPFYECICDAGRTGPSYQPGHAHADSLSFVMHVNNRPVIIDTGCSTYERGEIRETERGTAAHNTVTVAGENSGQVWGSHRVADRANVKILSESDDSISCSHDGYRKKGIEHLRTFATESPSILSVRDRIVGKRPNESAAIEALFHFAPTESIEINKNFVVGKDYKFVFEGATSVERGDFQVASGFNERERSTFVKVAFRSELNTTIHIS